MSKRLTKREKIDRAKKSAPDVPPITCPKIDFVLEMLDNVSTGVTDEMNQAEVELIRSTMEYIRSANDNLRESSYYWYKCYKATV